MDMFSFMITSVSFVVRKSLSPLKVSQGLIEQCETVNTCKMSCEQINAITMRVDNYTPTTDYTTHYSDTKHCPVYDTPPSTS